MLHYILLAASVASGSALQSPAQTLHDLKWTPTSMKYYATRPRKDAPVSNQTFVSCVRHFLVNRRRAILYVAYFALGVAPAKAVHHDKWTALRQAPQKASGIRMRRRRAQAISQFAGIGYSPRVVTLAGLMLRSLAKCFRMPMEPSIGFGVGAKLAAQYAHREWLPCLVLGWFAGGWYWDALDVKPPEWATGVPIVINRVRPGFGLRGGALIVPNVWAEGAARESKAKLLLDLREELPGERAAEQRLLTLFYATRRIVDASGRALPAGQAIDACLYSEPFDRGDAIGAGVPCLLEAEGKLVVSDGSRTPWGKSSSFETASDVATLAEALASAEAVAIPPDAKLWAYALTGAMSENDDDVAF